MKKLLFLSLILLGCIASQAQYRYHYVPEDGTKYDLRNIENKALTYASTMTVTPGHEENIYTLTLTGSPTIQIAKSSAYIGDRVHLILTASSSTRTITWGSNVIYGTATLAVTTTNPIGIVFVYNGTYWVATGAISSTGSSNYLTASVSQGAADTVFIVTPAGGTSPYTYSWAAAQTTTSGSPTLSGNTTGTVTITRKTALMRAKVTDANGLIAYGYFLFGLF